MQILTTILAFIIALGLLVTVHEYGHFWMARRMGVKVLRFSVGFGPALFRWRDKKDTEFWISAIPLGGYVKMLDRREAPVPDELLDQEFNQKTVQQRMAIFAAGPLVNLLFAALIYWVVMMHGVTQIAPIVGGITPHSVLAPHQIQPGWELTQIDGKPTADWEAVTFAFIKHIGQAGDVVLGFKAPGSDALKERRVWLNANWMETQAKEQDPLNALGLEPWQPVIAPVIGRLLAGSVAEQAGLQIKDRILSIADKSVKTWAECVAIIRQHPGQAINVTVQRQGKLFFMTVTPESVQEKGQAIGRLGVLPEPPIIPEKYLREIKYGVWQAAVAGIQKTAEFSWLTLTTLGKMLIGHVSVDNLSGPITIAKIAGDRASYGFEPFMSFVAYLSISLGVLNLLPVPVLDGGHLFFAGIEWIRRKPLSEKIQEGATKVGAGLILIMMVLAFYNDIARLL